MTEAASADAANETAQPESAAGTTAAPATSTPSPISFYAQYCFHLSPTLNQWCPMRVADVVRLNQYAEFEGQNVFFHLNHPIKCVRIAGVVVACNDFGYRRVYTVDDGSGATIECAVPRQAPPKAWQQAPSRQLTQTAVDIDLPGTVVNIKGELTTYRNALQIHIVRLAVLRATEQEVQFWAKVQAFAQGTLYRPWVLDRQTVRACRKAAMAVQRAKDEEEVRKEMQKEKETREKEEREREREREMEAWESEELEPLE